MKYLLSTNSTCFVSIIFIVLGMIFCNSLNAQEVNFDTTHVTVRLNSKFLNLKIIDDHEVKTTTFEEVLNERGRAELKIINDYSFDLSTVSIRKVFSFLSTSDSVSIGRQGNKVKSPPFWATFSAKVPPGVKYFEFLSSLQKSHPVAIWAHPNYKLQKASVPNDSLYSQQVSLNDPISGINIDSAWNINTGANWVKVGVFDTGIDSSHIDLEVLTGWLASDDQFNSWGEDLDGHGTHCAGIIGAKRNNVTGISGIAGGDGSDTTGVNLLDFRNGLNGIGDIELWSANVVNASRRPTSYYTWGGDFTNLTVGGYYQNAPGYGIHIANHSTAFVLGDLGKDVDTTDIDKDLIADCFLCREAMLFSLQNGVSSIAARGNARLSHGNPYFYVGEDNYPAAYHDGWTVSVGSSGIDGDRLISGVNSNLAGDFFSPIGQNIDLLAPGSADIVYTTETSLNGTLYSSFQGSSAAVPHVAGVVALLISEYNKPCYSNINLDPADIEYILEKSATPTSDNVPNGQYDIGAGHGRLNAHAALKMIEFPEYQIVHPQDTFISRQLLNQDTIVTYYRRPLYNSLVQDYGAPLSTGNPLTLKRPYVAVRYEEQLVYNFGQYILDSTQLLDAWVRHSQTNSLLYIQDTIIHYSNSAGNIDSSIVATDFDIAPMAYIDSIVGDSLIYFRGYFYHFIKQYPQEDLQQVFYTTPSPVDHWYPINPNQELPQIAYSIYIRDSTLAERYDFVCDSSNILIDSLATLEAMKLNFENKIFPNPGGELLNIHLDDLYTVQGKIQLLDMSGRLIDEIHITHERHYILPVEGLKKGMYFVHLMDGKSHSETHKWIKR